MNPQLPPGMENTPGIYYALAYWFSCTFYILMEPRHKPHRRLWPIHISFLAAIAGFMVLTDNRPSAWFFPSMAITVTLLLLDIKLCSGADWGKAGYTLARAFILGEFAASLEWQLFYFGLTVLRLPLRMSVNIFFLALSHGIVFLAMYLLERKHRTDYTGLRITRREVASAAVLSLSAFLVSNLSYAFDNTPFSSQFTADIFIIRTLVDLGGVVILYAYHVQLQELGAKMEMAQLQSILHMQYESYRISEESMALIDRKYHDLKHQIAVLRSEATSDQSRDYLDQMTQEIKAYEAMNKTGNRVLDTILSAKTVQCQNMGITLTCVADGALLDFMDPMDLSALFGNALDNAIEGVKGLSDPEKRLIHLSVARQKGFLRVRVENCYQGELRFENGIPATTKKDLRYHGFGIRSIRDTTAKYGGSMTISARDGWFELRLLFPLGEGGEPSGVPGKQ